MTETGGIVGVIGAVFIAIVAKVCERGLYERTTYREK